MPEFLWFCPDFCDLVHIKRIIDLLSKQQKNAVLERHPYFCTNSTQILPRFTKICPDSARIFMKIKLG